MIIILQSYGGLIQMSVCAGGWVQILDHLSGAFTELFIYLSGQLLHMVMNHYFLHLV